MIPEGEKAINVEPAKIKDSRFVWSKAYLFIMKKTAAKTNAISEETFTKE